jgi:L-lactate dehydrogenase complex protein LldE
MGLDKLTNTTATGAEVLCAADNSCLAHLSGLMGAGTGPAQRPDRAALRFVHLAEILAATGTDAGNVAGVAS